MMTFLRLKAFFIIVFLSLNTLQAQPWVVQPDDSLYVREHYDKMEVMIPMRDGIRQPANIILITMATVFQTAPGQSNG